MIGPSIRKWMVLYTLALVGCTLETPEEEDQELGVRESAIEEVIVSRPRPQPGFSPISSSGGGGRIIGSPPVLGGGGGGVVGAQKLRCAADYQDCLAPVTAFYRDCEAGYLRLLQTDPEGAQIELQRCNATRQDRVDICDQRSRKCLAGG